MSCRQDSCLSCGRVLQVTWLGTQRGATRPPAPQATGSSEIRPPAPVGSCAADGARGGSAGFSMPEHALTPIHTYLAKKGSRVLRPHVPSRSRLRTGPRCRGRARSDREHPHPRAPGQAARAPPRGQRAPVVPPRRRPPRRPRASRAASSWRKKNMRARRLGGGHTPGRAPAARRLIATARAAGQWGPGAGRAGGRACRRARQGPSPPPRPVPPRPRSPADEGARVQITLLVASENFLRRTCKLLSARPRPSPGARVRSAAVPPPRFRARPRAGTRRRAPSTPHAHVHTPNVGNPSQTPHTHMCPIDDTRRVASTAPPGRQQSRRADHCL